MNRKVIKKIMLFLLAFMLVFPVYSFGKAEAVQAAALKAPKLSKVVRVNKSVKITWKKSMICPLSSRQVKYLKVSDKNTYISFWSVGIFMHTISLYIF